MVPVCQWYIWRPVFRKKGYSGLGSSPGGRNSTGTSNALPSAVGNASSKRNAVPLESGVSTGYWSALPLSLA